MKSHPKVHPHDVLDDLYRPPKHSARRPPTQNRIARRRMGRNRSSAELFLKCTRMSAPAAASGELVAAGGDRTCGGTMLEEDDILRRVERKVRTPRSRTTNHFSPATLLGSQDVTSRRTAPNYQSFREQASPLARTHGSASVALRMRGAPGSPGWAPLEEQM